MLNRNEFPASDKKKQVCYKVSPCAYAPRRRSTGGTGVKTHCVSIQYKYYCWRQVLVVRGIPHFIHTTLRKPIRFPKSGRDEVTEVCAGYNHIVTEGMCWIQHTKLQKECAGYSTLSYRWYVLDTAHKITEGMCWIHHIKLQRYVLDTAHKVTESMCWI